MPLSTFLGLETTLRGILAQQLALDVTGHNIANANTIGYSRQTAVMAPTDAYTVPGVTRPPQAGQLGTGVDVQSYQRMRDEFLDIQYRAQSMRQGSAQAAQDGLRQIEVAFNEPSDNGLNSLLQSYWASWHDVSNAPENLATRQALAQNAASLANGFQSLATQLQDAQAAVSFSFLRTRCAQSIGDFQSPVWSSLCECELGGGAPEHALRHGFSRSVGIEHGIQGLVRQNKILQMSGCGGEVPCCDARPEQRADSACEPQRLLEVGAGLRICEQAAVYSSKHGMSRRLPLAMLSLFGDIQALQHCCQCAPVLSLRSQA